MTGYDPVTLLSVQVNAEASNMLNDAIRNRLRTFSFGSSGHIGETELLMEVIL